MAETLGLISSCLTIIELSAKIAGWCVEYSSAVKSAASDIRRLQRHAEALETAVEGHRRLLEGSSGSKFSVSRRLRRAVDECCEELVQLEQKLKPGRTQAAMSRFGMRALTWPFTSKDVSKIVGDIQSWMDIMAVGLQLDQGALIVDVNQEIVLSKLPTVSGAAYNSQKNEHAPKCHPETRLELLDQIRQWARDPNTKPLYWLNGMAGTGKSTISRTLAEYFDASGSLGASFFFKRGEHDRAGAALFCSTLAYQLAHQHAAVLPHIIQAIEGDPLVSQKPLKEQFDKLIIQPLSLIRSEPNRPWNFVIVVDALDECGAEKDVRTIISVFTQSQILHSAGLKVLLTSRPELPIRLGFAGFGHVYEYLILHEVPPIDVERDLFIYLRDELVSIKEEFNGTVPPYRQLPSNWPDPDHVQILSRSASPLFIVAATMTRIISDRSLGDPDDQLARLLQDETEKGDNVGGNLSTTYLSVLNPLIVGRSDRDKDYILQQFRGFVGPIILLQTPLSTRSLERLLEIPQRTIHRRLDFLHSVFSIPSNPDGLVRLFHLSFRDFLLDRDNTANADFRIEESKVHAQLASQCLSLLTTRAPLGKNICQLAGPGTLQSDIESAAKERHLPPDVQYACLNWAHHLSNSQTQIIDGDGVHDFLQAHFLHWLEALSIMGRLSESIDQITALHGLTQPKTASEVSAFLKDARRFVLSNSSVVALAPLQVYSSALINCPLKSVVRTSFEMEISACISLPPKPEPEWSAALMKLEGHSEVVSSVAFSSDSTLIASASDDRTVRVWEAETGAHVQTLEGHGHNVAAVVFSPDSQLVVSASHDCTIRLWSTQTGDHLKTLEGHSRWVNCVDFSPDSRFIASGSSDKTVRLWSAAAGQLLRILNGHTMLVYSVVFSGDSKLIASGSKDNSVRIWSTDTGERIHLLEGHDGLVTSVTFSPDSSLVASAALDGSVRIWSVVNGNNLPLYNIQGHSGIRSVACSPDSELIAFTCGKSVQVRTLQPSEQHWTLAGHSGTVTSAVFSPDSRLVASASSDKCIRIWSTNRNEWEQAAKDQAPGRIRSVYFAPDSRTIAVTSGNNISLWSADTGECQHTLQGHTGLVSSISFSHDSSLLASASTDGTARVFSVETGSYQQTLQGRSRLTSIAFSRDSSRLAVGGDGGRIDLWELNTGVCEQTFTANCQTVASVTFSPRMDLLAAASRDPFTSHMDYHAVQFWSLETGFCRQVLENYGDVCLIAVSDNSNLIASFSRHRSSINVWSVQTGELLQQFSLNCQIYDLYFSSDETTLHTTSGQISLVFPSQPETIAAVDVDHGYNLSRDDSWITYLGQNLLWLPTEYRPSWTQYATTGASASRGSTVVLGCDSGEVKVIKFSSG